MFSSYRALLALVVGVVALPILLVSVSSVLGDTLDGAPDEAPRSSSGVVGDLAVGGLGGGMPSPPPTDDVTLTVPRLERVKGVPLTTAPSDDESALDAGLMHLKGTGLPWEEGSNVYIAGHRIGWPGTLSDRVFYDLDRLATGDEVILTDGLGRDYRYRVYEEFEVGPDETSVTEPVPGKSVVTLQTCTLPDYARRIVVRAELEDPA